jgi:hypothetical protein
MQYVLAIISVLIASNLVAAAAERLKFWNLTDFNKGTTPRPSGNRGLRPDQVPERSRWRCRG